MKKKKFLRVLNQYEHAIIKSDYMVAVYQYLI